MRLYLIHCGYYDQDVCDGVYEGHVNIFVAAESQEAAKIKVRTEPSFVKKKMHIDGMQELNFVDGYTVKLVTS